MFPQTTEYPKAADFYLTLNNKVSPPNSQKKEVNLHLEIDGIPWKVEILTPRTFNDRYWLPDTTNRILYICGLEDQVDSIKYDCWMQYHTKP